MSIRGTSNEGQERLRRATALKEVILTAEGHKKLQKEIKSGEVSIGTKVRLKDMDANQTVEYHIVGSAEANPAEHKLSNESPVGKAIMGRKKGEVVEVSAPRGSLKYKILDIKAA